MKLLFPLCFIALLDLLHIVDVRGESTCSIEGNCPNQEDADEECEDRHENCEFWAGEEQCEENPGYMLEHCRKACRMCYNRTSEEDYGVSQNTGGSDNVEILRVIEDMQAYFQRLRNDPSTSPKMHEVLDNCKLRHENCAFWKVHGECEKV